MYVYACSSDYVYNAYKILHFNLLTCLLTYTSYIQLISIMIL